MSISIIIILVILNNNLSYMELPFHTDNVTSIYFYDSNLADKYIVTDPEHIEEIMNIINQSHYIKKVNKSKSREHGVRYQFIFNLKNKDSYNISYDPIGKICKANDYQYILKEQLENKIEKWKSKIPVNEK